MPVGHAAGRRLRGRRIGVLAAAVLAVTLAVTGCTTFQKASTAAFVNGTAISDSTVTQVVSQFNDNLATSDQQKVTESQVLGVLILAPFVLGQVKSSGSWAPDARYNTALRKIPDATQATKDFLATSVVLQQGGPLTENDVTAILGQLKKADVVLDPRFGTWDPSSGGFLTQDNNWIKPTATPAGGATPGSSPAPTESPTESPTDTSSPTGTATGQ